MKACIYGVGAIGGWIGTRLAAAGCEVSAVARGETLRALRANGLRLESAAASSLPASPPPVPGQAPAAAAPASLHAAVRAEEDPAVLGVQDLVVLAVKAPALPAVAARIAPLIGPQTLVLTAMNGVPWWFFEGFGGALQGTRLEAVDPGGAIAAAIPGRQVIGCVVHASCATTAPGVVRLHQGNRLIVGEPAGGSSERVEALAALLRRAGFEIEVSAQIQRDTWFKLWGNMTVNPISAFTGATTDRIMDDELVRGFITRIMLEAREIGARLGIPIAQEPEDRHAVTRKLGAFKTSMLQDVEAGRPVELDALVTVVRELGLLTQVPTPFMDALLGLARLHARQRGLY